MSEKYDKNCNCMGCRIYWHEAHQMNEEYEKSGEYARKMMNRSKVDRNALEQDKFNKILAGAIRSKEQLQREMAEDKLKAMDFYDGKHFDPEGLSNESGGVFKAWELQAMESMKKTLNHRPDRHDLHTLSRLSPIVRHWMYVHEDEDLPLEQALIGMVTSLVQENKDIMHNYRDHLLKCSNSSMIIPKG